MGEERSSIACLRNPLPLLHPRRYRHQRTTHGQSDSLNLLCWTLSFPTPIRFIPALSCVPLSLFKHLARKCLTAPRSVYYPIPKFRERIRLNMRCIPSIQLQRSLFHTLNPDLRESIHRVLELSRLGDNADWACRCLLCIYLYSRVAL